MRREVRIPTWNDPVLAIPAFPELHLEVDDSPVEGISVNVVQVVGIVDDYVMRLAVAEELDQNDAPVRLRDVDGLDLDMSAKTREKVDHPGICEWPLVGGRPENPQSLQELGVD